MTCSDGFYDSLQSSLYPHRDYCNDSFGLSQRVVRTIAMTRKDYPNEPYTHKNNKKQSIKTLIIRNIV